jgi:hypothetical protein
MCPHTTIHVSSYYYMCPSYYQVTRPPSAYLRTYGAYVLQKALTIYVSSYYYICPQYYLVTRPSTASLRARAAYVLKQALTRRRVCRGA